MSFTKVDEREKQAALEEEQARLKALKVALVFLHYTFTLSKHLCSVSVACIFVLNVPTHSGTEAQRALQEALLRYH